MLIRYWFHWMIVVLPTVSCLQYRFLKVSIWILTSVIPITFTVIYCCAILVVNLYTITNLGVLLLPFLATTFTILHHHIYILFSCLHLLSFSFTGLRMPSLSKATRFVIGWNFKFRWNFIPAAATSWYKIKNNKD